MSYVTRGPNTGPGQISVKCPWCGAADPSEHLSISLSGAGWRCFRNPRAHSGRSRSWLISGLLNVSLEEAKRLAGEDASPPPEDEDFAVRVAGLLGENQVLSAGTGNFSPRLQLPKEFKRLRWGPKLARPFWEYLRSDKRKFTPGQIDWLVQNYGLHYATSGPYRYRIIIPIYDAEQRLKTWTARSILADEELRYKTLSKRGRYGLDEPVALEGPTNLLLGLPLLLRAKNPQTLVLCEGPFDAMRISVLGWHLGVYGTCLFGLNISDSQAVLLDRLMKRFKKLVLLVDPEAWALNIQMQDQLNPLPIHVGKLPEGVEDPGALPAKVGRELIQSWL